MSEVHTARRAQLGPLFVELQACGILTTQPADIAYLTGLTCRHAAVLVTALDVAVLATHSRCAPTARRLCPDLEVIVDEHGATALMRLAVSLRLGRIAVDDHLTAPQRAELTAVAAGVPLIPLDTAAIRGAVAPSLSACGLPDRG